MPQNTAQLLNFVLGIKQLHQSEAEQAYKEKLGSSNALNEFVDKLKVAKNPASVNALKKFYGDSYHIANGVLDELSQQYAPSIDEMKRNTAAEGLQRMRDGAGAKPIPQALEQLLSSSAGQNIAGMSPGAIAQSGAQAGMINDAAGAPGGFSNAMRQGFLNQIFRSQNSGQAAVTDATTALPQADLTQASKIGLDLVPGAGNKLNAETQTSGQNLAHAAAMAGIAQQQQQMIQQYGLETVNQAIEREKLKAMTAKGGQLTAAEQMDAAKAALAYLAHPGITEGAQQIAPDLLNNLLNQAGLPAKAGPNVTDMPWKINK